MLKGPSPERAATTGLRRFRTFDGPQSAAITCWSMPPLSPARQQGPTGLDFDVAADQVNPHKRRIARQLSCNRTQPGGRTAKASDTRTSGWPSVGYHRAVRGRIALDAVFELTLQTVQPCFK
jgi:hypothetical protein